MLQRMLTFFLLFFGIAPLWAVDLMEASRVNPATECDQLLKGLNGGDLAFREETPDVALERMEELGAHKEALQTSCDWADSQLQLPNRERDFKNPLFLTRLFFANPVDAKLKDQGNDARIRIQVAESLETQWQRLAKLEPLVPKVGDDGFGDELYLWLKHRTKNRVGDLMALQSRWEEGDPLYETRLKHLIARIEGLKTDIDHFGKLISRNGFDISRGLSLFNKMMAQAGHQRIKEINAWAKGEMDRQLERSVMASLANTSLRLDEPQKTTLERFHEMDKLGMKVHDDGVPDHHLLALGWTVGKRGEDAKETMDRFGALSKYEHEGERIPYNEATMLTDLSFEKLHFRGSDTDAIAKRLFELRDESIQQREEPLSYPALALLTRTSFEHKGTSVPDHIKGVEDYRKKLFKNEDVDDLTVALLYRDSLDSPSEVREISRLISGLKKELNDTHLPKEDMEDVARLAIFAKATKLTSAGLGRMMKRINELNGHPVESERMMTIIAIALTHKFGSPMKPENEIGVRLTDNELRVGLDIPFHRAITPEDRLTEFPLSNKIMADVPKPFRRSSSSYYYSGGGSYSSSSDGDDGSFFGSGTGQIGINTQGHLTIGMGGGFGIDLADGSISIGSGGFGFDLDF